MKYNVYSDGYVPKSTSVGAYSDIGSVLGEDSKVQCQVSIPPGWNFGDRVFIGPGVHFANDKHPDLEEDFKIEYGSVGDDVVIGMGALIGAGVEIGESATVGMGAVVLKDVEAGTTVVGNPAKPLWTKETKSNYAFYCEKHNGTGFV